MNIHQEIIKWSMDKPDWVRDALRLLIGKNTLDSEDISRIKEICKRGKGLCDKPELYNPEFISIEKLPIDKDLPDRIAITNVENIKNINALAPNQKLKLNPEGLVVIYGDNGSGKSGYARILKSACRARGQVTLLPNVLNERAESQLTATIKYRFNDTEESFAWEPTKENPQHLGYISVFDSNSAGVYLNEKTDVAFRPLGLDLFDRMANVFNELRTALVSEKETLANSKPALPILNQETEAGKYLMNLTPLSSKDKLKKLATLSAKEIQEIDELKTTLSTGSIEERKKQATVIKLRVDRYERAMRLLRRWALLFEDEKIDRLEKISQKIEKLKLDLASIQKTAQDFAVIGPVGTEAWFSLWEAADTYWQTSDFDGIKLLDHEGSYCLFCHQSIQKEASERLQAFKNLFESKTKEKLDLATHQQTILIEEYQVNASNSLEIDTFLIELENEDSELATSFKENYEKLKENWKLFALKKKNFSPFDLGQLQLLNKLIERNRLFADRLEETKDSDIEALKGRLSELSNRQKLNEYTSNIAKEIDRLRKVQAYEACIAETDTRQLSRKSTQVTKATVTDALIQSFHQELEKINFTPLSLELAPAGGKQGVLYHQIKFSNSTAKLNSILSEGEARALSVCAFFSELTTTATLGGIIFDDPVSSLDHKWRDRVAERLVQESEKRQVIVFTHDIVFLLRLKEYTDQKQTTMQSHYIRRQNKSAGFLAERLPWPALKVNSRIGYLKDLWQSAEKKNRKGDFESYEKEGCFIYGLLREAWERAIEEILLNGTIERFRKSVETNKAQYLSDITEEDLCQLTEGMTKTSTWLAGHDHAAALGQPFPEPAEIKADIEHLEKWVSKIRKRRN